MMGVAAAIASLSMRLSGGAAASVATSVLARPELVTTCSFTTFIKMMKLQKHKYI